MTTQNVLRVSGNSAIALAESNNLTLSKFADPMEGARSGLTIQEAKGVASEDPGLIYADVVCTGWTGDSTGYNVADYFRGTEYLGADESGVEPTFALAE